MLWNLQGLMNKHYMLPRPPRTLQLKRSINQTIFRYLQLYVWVIILTVAISRISRGCRAWSVTTEQVHWSLSSVWITRSRTGTPVAPCSPCPFNWKRQNQTLENIRLSVKSSLYSHSQGPVSVGVVVHGLLPLWSIERCLPFELHVPEQAPQLPHDVHAPSTEIQ